MVWGDGPADIMGDAVAQITVEYEKEWGRKPSREELHAGLDFHVLDVLPEEAPAREV